MVALVEHGWLKRGSSKLWAGMLLAGVGLVSGLGLTMPRVWAVAPRMLPPVVSGGSTTLSLGGVSGTNYRVEYSTNLITWSSLGTGVAQNGVFTVVDAAVRNVQAVYYRGVQVAAAGVYPSVVPTLDTNAMTHTIVRPDAPTELQLRTAGGVVYTISFPTNAFWEPTLVRLSALSSVNGMPNQAGLLAGVRLEPEGVMPLVPLFLQIDFPDKINARQVSSMAFGNSGAGLHLVPDVVVSNGPTNRVRILMRQLQSHGCGVFTLAELKALASTQPPPRLSAGRAGAQPAASMEECYPDEEKEAAGLQHHLEDVFNPMRQSVAESLGEARQEQLLGVGDSTAGVEAIQQALVLDDKFYQAEIQPRLTGAASKCAVTKTLAPWVLGHHRQAQLLGTETDNSSADLSQLVDSAEQCKKQALACCKAQGGDTRLIQVILGAERQQQLLGGGGGISIEDVLKDCAPDWFGTLSIHTTGHYKDVSTNGVIRVTRSMNSEVLLTAAVMSAKVRVSQASIFAPANTNISCVLGGTLVASVQMEQLEENFDSSCRGIAGAVRRDTWNSATSTNVSNVTVEALILKPGSGNLFVSPYLTIAADDNESVRDLRWTWEEDTTERSPFADEDCVTTIHSGGSYDPNAGFFLSYARAKEGEFSYTSDSIHYEFSGPEPMEFDYEHLFNGTKEVRLELKKVK